MQCVVGIPSQLRRRNSLLCTVWHAFNRTSGSSNYAPQRLLLGTHHGRSLGNWRLCISRSWFQGPTILRHCNGRSDLGLGSAHLGERLRLHGLCPHRLLLLAHSQGLDLTPSILALLFVTLDIVSVVIQLIGGGMAGPGASPDAQKKGLNIFMGRIGMQEGFVVLFLGLVLRFHRDQLQAERMGRLPAERFGRWEWLLYALYACLLAVTIGIVYRLAAFSAGQDASNPLPSNEPLRYVLESTPMWLAMFVWNIVHLGRFITGPDDKMPR